MGSEGVAGCEVELETVAEGGGPSSSTMLSSFSKGLFCEVLLCGLVEGGVGIPDGLELTGAGSEIMIKLLSSAWSCRLGVGRLGTSSSDPSDGSTSGAFPIGSGSEMVNELSSFFKGADGCHLEGTLGEGGAVGGESSSEVGVMGAAFVGEAVLDLVGDGKKSKRLEVWQLLSFFAFEGM